MTGSDGCGHCFLYAMGGMLVASIVTGRDYSLQAGSLLVGTGDVNEEGELYLQMDPAVTGYNGLEGHAWFARQVPPRIEWVDLSTRHFHAMADRYSGGRWQREELPPFFWGYGDELKVLRIRERPDPLLMDQLRYAPQQQLDQAQRVAAVAVRAIRSEAAP